jgi:hypothetical protein
MTSVPQTVLGDEPQARNTDESITTNLSISPTEGE